jgi:hypothetical protein
MSRESIIYESQIKNISEGAFLFAKFHEPAFSQGRFLVKKQAIEHKWYFVSKIVLTCCEKKNFLTFSCMFLNPNNFFQFEF